MELVARILRLTVLIPTFVNISFVNIYFGTSAVYFPPWMEVCEALALVSFFFLVCNQLSSRLDPQNDRFEVTKAYHNNAAALDPTACTQLLWGRDPADRKLEGLEGWSW